MDLRLRFDETIGIADSDWFALAPGIATLTGRNNAGKSRVLRLISNLASAVSGDSSGLDLPQVRITTEAGEIVADLRPAPSVPAFYKATQQGNLTKVDWGHEQSGNLLLMISQGPEDRSSSNVVSRVNIGGRVTSPQTVLQFLPQRNDLVDVLARLVYLPPQRVIPATVPTAPIEHPGASGLDLGQAIYTHRNRYTAQFQAFKAAVCRMFPEISRVLTDPRDAGHVTLKVHDRYAGEDIPLNQTGTGFSQLLHLIASVLFLPEGRLLLVDEPQLHLHPGAEKQLADFVHEHPEHDYVFATHSHTFIDQIEPNHVLLLSRDESGTNVQ